MNPDQLKNTEEFVPLWAKKAVWYQIFPERFRNGDPSNDPIFENIRGCWPHDTTSPWQISPWTSDWYELQPWEKQNGKNVWYNIQRRRYGGDIKGIIDKLDYLQELGVNAIYLNPVFEAPSLHKYDGATYHHVDPNFGPDPDGDRKLIASEIPDDPSTWNWTQADKLVLKLIEEIHKRGMRIIFDGVFNHMGINSFAFKDVLKNQQKSRFKDWFTIKSWNNPAKGEKFDYEGWFGVKDLPELREDENGIVKGPREYIFAATKRWMDPAGNGNTLVGIDGWRLDVAFCVKHAFWKDWRKVVKSINPEAYLTAEVIDSIKAIQPYLEGDEFDAVMNYNFAFISSEYFIDENNRLKTSEFDKKLKELRESFITGVSFVQQNLFDSHDTNRLLSHIVNRDLASYSNWPDFFQKSKAENTKYNTRKPNGDEIQIQKLMAIFQMTYLGAPMIYYGDEAGMWGANDPCCRKPMVWEDNKYEDEIFLPDQTKKFNPDKVEFNKDIFKHYKKLIEIRNSLPVLQLGDFHTVLADNKNEVYVFSRNYESQKVIVVINNSRLKKSVRIPVTIKEEYYDVLNGEQFNSDTSEIKIKLNSKWAAILVRKN
ncbi:MAG: glycoside hydrolase family 13 protein [Ignavibacteriales bacterium]|nr:glycoside hydrolase family 13 protein [Ignavibacteriales bacterium]